MNEAYLNSQELADHLKVSLSTVRSWISKGLPHDVFPGGLKRKTRRFQIPVVQDWLSSVEGTGKKADNGRRHMAGLYKYRVGKNKSEVWRYWFEIDGQRTYGSTNTTDQTKAKEIYIQAYNTALEGKKPPKGRITLEEAFAGYLQWSKAENKESTYYDKVNKANTILRHFGGKRRLNSIDVADIEQYKIKRKSEFAKHRKRQTQVTGATINRELTVLQGLFTWAVAWRKIAGSPFHTGAIKKYKEEQTQGKYLDIEEKRRLIEGCSDKFRPAVVTVLNTGLRLGEVKRLLWQHVNLGLRVIHVVQTKSKKTRTIMMGPGLIEMFKRLPKRSDFVFTHEDGRPFSTNYIETEFKRACMRSSVMNFTFHDLRDVFSTDFYKETKDIRKLQRVLGHSSISTTERYLATLGLGDTKEADAISEAIFDDSVKKALGIATPPGNA